MHPSPGNDSTELRELRHDPAEIEIVARNMRQTLIDVMGEERGAGFYSLEWLIERVRWHLAPERTAKVLVVEGAGGRIVGHAIVRVEVDEGGERYGYFSTIFVEEAWRRKGLGKRLLTSVERWVQGHQLRRVIYNTAASNKRLLPLFLRHGYRVSLQEGEMVQLTRELAGPSG
ncbi:MAG: GNAT family N-acetyltransferase [Polyangiaceae bacterium]|jgi:GNAT superfamily N-acetyltransferase|nr:GNAT family N-acetyltransferase [Polyangiaceae bacterium]